MYVKLALLFLSSAFALHAQSSPVNPESAQSPGLACPLQIIRTYTHDCKQCSSDFALRIELKNVASKRITGSEYGLEMEDAVGNRRLYPLGLVSAYRISAGKPNYMDWGMLPYISEISRGGTVWIKKVMFEDGTSWQGEDRACAINTVPDPAKSGNWFTRH